ncbi:hypothetical protein WMF31_18460 [Sorangium sp. So ce1036]|uniref:hypothetical protein n=1 Tax=Sorangium sp. So ce1036 TaxID=3133328 RepID=UPI003F06591F
MSFGCSSERSFFRSFLGSTAGAASARSERAATFLLTAFGFAALPRASLVFVAFVLRARPAATLVLAALGFATRARVVLAFVALAFVALAFVALAFTARALTFATLLFALALAVLSLAALRVDFAFVRAAAVFLALVALARFAAARVVFFAFLAAGFFLALARVVVRAGVRVVLRRAGVAALRAVARLVVVFRRFAALAAEVRRAAGREAAALRFGLRAAGRAAGFAFRVRAVDAARLELAALALVALFRSFFAVFRVFFAAMGVLSHNRSGCPLPPAAS